MAKKKRMKKISKSQQVTENTLPQNILLIGERDNENKSIYISQPVYKEIQKFTKNKITDESGGMLIGTVVEEFGKTNILVNGFIEAKHCEATPTTLKFTHETWEYCHKEMDKKFPGQKIVGWIHTHPNFGIFLSEYDKFIQENFFKEDYQIAYVVDPIQQIEGFYFWENDKIERSQGFYKFAKTGVKLEKEKTTVLNDETEGSFLTIQNIVIGILTICVALLAFSNFSLRGQHKALEKKVQVLEKRAQILDAVLPIVQTGPNQYGVRFSQQLISELQQINPAPQQKEPIPQQSTPAAQQNESALAADESESETSMSESTNGGSTNE